MILIFLTYLPEKGSSLGQSLGYIVKCRLKSAVAMWCTACALIFSVYCNLPLLYMYKL